MSKQLTDVIRCFDQEDYDLNPGKYLLFKTARLAEPIESSPELQVGCVYSIKFVDVLFNASRRAKMPIYDVTDAAGDWHYVFACVLGDFVL